MLSLHDLTFYREGMHISFDSNVSSSQNLDTNYKFKIRLPFPNQDEEKKDNLIFRFLFKPETGALWGFNKFFHDRDLYHQINYTDFLKPNV